MQLALTQSLRLYWIAAFLQYDMVGRYDSLVGISS